MTGFVLRRLWALLPILLFVSLVAFLALAACPGDPARISLAALTGDESPSAQAVEAERARLGLDAPLPARYAAWLGRTLRGDLGVSIQTGRPVTREVLDAAAATGLLALAAMSMATVLVLVLGVGAAVFRGTWVDSLALLVSLALGSVPDFFFALLGILFLAVRWRWLPVAGFGSPAGIVLPALSLALASTAVSARLMRSGMVQAMTGKFLTGVRARGVSETRVIGRHALKNALAPVLAYLGAQLGFLFGGTAVIETIFAWPGLGRLLVEAIKSRDMFVVQGCVLAMATVYVCINLVVDILHAAIDPRVRRAA
ncbi:MAG: ABC transporter permease [Pseudodesulfovibrio sp.]